MTPHYMRACVFFFVLSVSAGVCHGAPLDEKSIDAGLEQVAAGDYSAASDSFDRVIASAPERPEGYFFKASVFHILKGHIPREDYQETWRKNAEKAMALSEALLEKNPEDTRALLLAGLTEGMRIVDALDSSSYLTAFLRAGAMQNHLEKALELDPKIHDAYYGLGIYHIRGSTESWVRMFRFFIGDTSAKGRAYLRRAVDGKGWLANTARQALIWALYRAKKFQEARGDVEYLLARYPKNVLYDVAYAESFFIAGDYPRARAEYVKLLSRLKEPEDEISGLYREFSKWRVIRCDYALGEQEEVEEETRELLTEKHMYSSLMEQIRLELESASDVLKEK